MQWNGEHVSSLGGADTIGPLKNPFFTTLVADDELSFEAFLAEFFKTQGYFILKAETAREALDCARKYLPDLILLNSTLGDVTGISLIQELLLEQPKAAVILMTFKPNVAEAVEAMKLGAVDYLQRPLDPEKVQAVIENQKALFNIP